ncbi:MAG: uroporphyrinogen decarboxylase family protein [Promethearchaeati archaeon]
MNYITNIYKSLQKGDPWFSLFAIEAYMESHDIEQNPLNQIKALKEFQKTYNFDITFPRMDLDEYVEIVSNVKKKKINISKSQDWAQFEPKEIIRSPTLARISQSSTYQVLKNLYESSDGIFRYKGGYIPAPYTLVSLILDLQVASELVIYNPEFLKSLIEFSQSIINFYAKMISEFVDTLFILAPSECTIMKRSYIDIIQDSMNKLIKYCVSELNKPTLIHFCAKKISHVLNDDIIGPMKDAGIIGLNIPNVIENIQLAKKYNLILCGGIDPVSIQIQPKEKTLKDLKQLIKDTKNIPFIYATNCQIKWAPGQISSRDLNKLFSEIKQLLR